MLNITEVDALEVLVLVDNVTDSLSSNPPDVLPEWSVLLTGGKLRVLAGSNICCAHHGLSVLLTARVGSRKRTLLFDAGPAAATFQRNTEILGVDFASIEAVVLSHGHWDHAGGLLAAVESIARSRGSKSFTCYVHPGMFRQRATKRPDGQLYVNELVPDPERLSAAGAKVINTREPQSVADGAFYVSGEIPRVTSYEAGVPNHLTRSADGNVVGAGSPHHGRAIRLGSRQGQGPVRVLGLFARRADQRPDACPVGVPLGSALRRDGWSASLGNKREGDSADRGRSQEVRVEAAGAGPLHRLESPEPDGAGVWQTSLSRRRSARDISFR